MKRKIAPKSFLIVLTGLLLAAASASAQSIAYRQTNLASDVSTAGFANQKNPSLQNSWGIAFLPRQSFFVANTRGGRVTVLDATGAGTPPASFTVPGPAGAGPDSPIGIVSDPNSFFGGRALVQPFIIATQEGNIFQWGPDANGNFLQEATLVFNNAQSGAVYTGVAILEPGCCAPFLAVANFHSGRIETYDTQFAPLSSFLDPNLPPGYAPFGMQVIGKQLFVAFAVQDAAKSEPVSGAGNGIVSIFDLEGHFVRRFATAGTLNAPWGITQASANFGPFSNDILVGNVGDGTISAFDPVTGNFIGQIKDGSGNLIVNDGLHGLAFRSDGFGDPNTLYFTAGISDGLDGLFGAMTPSLVSATRVSVQATSIEVPTSITVTVSAGPGNAGTPTGLVAVQDGGVPILDVALINGAFVVPQAFDKAGTHVIQALYKGDATFLPSTSSTEVDVAGQATTVTLAAPADATPGATILLTATVSSAAGVPTGQIIFHDGNAILGTVPLSAAAVAILRVNTLSAGAHSLTALYSGDDKLAASASTPVTTTVAGRDFSLGATPAAANVTAGQSSVFNISVTPAGGFADPVSFSCPVISGITCNFNPPMVTPNGGVATTMLTVTTSANVNRYGQALGPPGSGLSLAGLGLIGILTLLRKRTRRPHAVFLRGVARALATITLALTLASCGGYATNGQTNRGTASIAVTAQSGTISHTTTINVTVQ